MKVPLKVEILHSFKSFTCSSTSGLSGMSPTCLIQAASPHWLYISPTEFEFYSVACPVLCDLISACCQPQKYSSHSSFCWGSTLDIGLWRKWLWSFKNVWKLLFKELGYSREWPHLKSWFLTSLEGEVISLKEMWLVVKLKQKGHRSHRQSPACSLWPSSF